MSKRKVIIEIDLNDDRINSIEDLEQEILSQEIYGQVARKYLDSLQDDMARPLQFVLADKIKPQINANERRFSGGVSAFIRVYPRLISSYQHVM